MITAGRGVASTALRLIVERTSDRELVMSRTFRASADIVYDAFTKPEYVRRWWAPATRGVTIAECVADLRPGGKYRYVLAHGERERFAFFGKYVELTHPTRLVYTQTFDPSGGCEAPDEAFAVVTVSFEEKAGSTLFRSHELYPSKEVLDGALSVGMEDGARETFDQLDELVASLQR
jgi:uncharacterized protein YndB with AHSA1/START domain